MILILGGSGFIGSAIRLALDAASLQYHNVSRRNCDYTRRDQLIGLIREMQPKFLINVAGYTGNPNVDACEVNKADCLMGNAVLPGIVREACELCEIPWGHVSSGCIYTGAKSNGDGFSEEDEPNFCFRTDNYSFYSGSKALGEECLTGAENVFVWRPRIPFNETDSGRNYLSKLIRYERLLDARNSISHLDEFANACVQSWVRRIPFGIYNVTNTGSITTREIVSMIQELVCPDREFSFFESEAEFMRLAAKTPRSNCVMDNSKLLAAGIPMSHVKDALRGSLRNWQSEANQRASIVAGNK